MIKFLSLLSEFDFKGYMPLILNLKKEVMNLLFSHFKLVHNASQIAATG